MRDTFVEDRLPPAELLPEFRFDLPELHYPERLNAAAQWQRAKRVRANRFSRVDRLRIRIGNQLIALGHSVKAVARPAPQCDEAPPATSRR